MAPGFLLVVFAGSWWLGFELGALHIGFWEALKLKCGGVS